MTSSYSLSLTAPCTVNLTPYAPRQAPTFTGTSSFEGPLLLSAGSAAAPALSFVMDRDTGMTNSQADGLGIVCGGAEQLRIVGKPGAVNVLQASGSSNDEAPTLSAQGSQASVSLALARKGAGTIRLIGADPFNFGVEVGISGTANRTCYIDMHAQPDVDYSTRFLRSPGVDGTFVLNNSGTGGIQIKTGGTNAETVQFSVQHQSLAVNYVAASGGASGSPVTVQAQGADSSVDLGLIPKGTAGRVRFGVFTAQAGATIAGHVEIRDAAGALRKLAVIA
ncbi:hypothetical protein EI613_32200 (plasmid) [Azospirillum sp. 412522]|nr:hypothetical protein [Azospirillum sp. 412522]MBY6266515.1 hypothetical protein [Azospirillum sp. 412522]